MAPGKYYVSAQKLEVEVQSVTAPKPDIRTLRTYYPQATTLETAAPVEVSAGQDVSGINIQLVTAKTYHVRGSVVGDLSQIDVSKLHVSVARGDEVFSIFLGGGQLKKDRTFDVAGIAPGSYKLVLVNRNGTVVHLPATGNSKRRRKHAGRISPAR